MTRRNLLSFLAPAVLTVAGLTTSAPAQEGFGTIKGRLIYGGAEIPTPKVEVAKGDQSAKDAAVCAVNGIVNKTLVVDPSTKGIANGFAFLVKPTGSNPDAEKALLGKAAEVVIDQKNCEFVPYSTAIHKDQTLVFKSSDPVGHNIRYSGFNIGAANQMLAPSGQMPVKFATSERRPIQLACDIHPWMQGYFMVFDHPFFAVTKADGTFEISGIPAGTQQLIVWQASKGYVSTGLARGQAITVEPGKTTDVGDFLVK